MDENKFLLIIADATTLGKKVNLLNNTDHIIYICDNSGVEVYALQIGDNKTFTVVLTGETYGWQVTDHIPTSTTLSYSIDREVWQGQNDIKAEYFATNNQIVYSVKGLKIYEQNKGNQLNGANINAYIIGILNVEPYFDKEFIAISIGSNVKPTKVEFATSLKLLPQCTLSYTLPLNPNVYYLKNYGGKFTNKIPRKAVAPNDRLQGKCLVFKITHNENDEEFWVSDVLINFDRMKLLI